MYSVELESHAIAWSTHFRCLGFGYSGGCGQDKCVTIVRLLRSNPTTINEIS